MYPFLAPFYNPNFTRGFTRDPQKYNYDACHLLALELVPVSCGIDIPSSHHNNLGK